MSKNQVNQKDTINAYLARIGFEGPIDQSVETLTELQEAHLSTIPYENFDILKGIPLSLDIPHLFDKIVVRHRGGYCFELNALFGWLLNELGYTVTNYFARFWRDEPKQPPKRRHHVLAVEAEGEVYLCDVGVGGIVPRQPIQMIEGLIHQQGEEVYKLDIDPYYGWMLCENKRGKWERIYSFTEEPQLLKDYTMASYWCENAPESIFRKEAMVAIRTTEGRNSVAGNEFRIFKGDEVHTFIPKTDDEYAAALQKYFGIIL